MANGDPKERLSLQEQLQKARDDYLVTEKAITVEHELQAKYAEQIGDETLKLTAEEQLHVEILQAQ